MTRLLGTASYLENGQWHPLKVGQFLRPGCTIKNDPAIEDWPPQHQLVVRLNNRDVGIVLDQGSELKLIAINHVGRGRSIKRSTEVALLSGSAYIDAHNIFGTSSCIVRVPNGLATFENATFSTHIYCHDGEWTNAGVMCVDGFGELEWDQGDHPAKRKLTKGIYHEVPPERFIAYMQGGPPWLLTSGLFPNAKKLLKDPPRPRVNVPILYPNDPDQFIQLDLQRASGIWP